MEHFRQYPEIVNHHEKGTIPSTVMWGSCPTVFDPSQAPPGKHTAFMWEKLPYRLNGDARNWDREKDIHGKQMLDLWTGYAPNLEHDVIDWFTRSAVDTERTFPNMKSGDLLIGAFSNGQIGDHRPLPESFKGTLPLWIRLSSRRKYYRLARLQLWTGYFFRSELTCSLGSHPS